MKVVITEAAWSDMLGIGRAILADNPARAESFLGELHHCCMALADMPERYPVLPAFRDRGIRRRVHGNYLIFYRIENDRLDVLHVLHGARDYDSLFREEN